MGNSMGGKSVKVMKISGETIKFKTPVKAGEVIKDHPGLVLLDSEAVKHYGVRAKPLEAHQELNHKRLYFLVELPKGDGSGGGSGGDGSRQGRVARRVRSGITMSAKDRLESLMLARRSVSDLSIINPTLSNTNTTTIDNNNHGLGASVPSSNGGDGVRVKMKLPKAEVERIMRESKDEAEAAEKIMNLYITANRNNTTPNYSGDIGGKPRAEEKQVHDGDGSSHGSGTREMRSGGIKKREKKVSFLPAREGDLCIAAAS